MTKLLVEAPSGFQELLEVGEGGGYFDESRVLWDERKDGAFPESLLPEVGGLARSGESLVVDAAKKAAHQTKQAEKAAAEQAKVDAKTARKAAIKGLGSANSVAAMRTVVRAMAEELGFEIE
jgi:hypothetical protein